MIRWSGIFHILATPFTDDGSLDTAGLPHLVERALATGISGVTILGIAGEAHRLTDEERGRVVDAVVKEVAGRVPVVAGVSAPGTHLASAFARMAREHGADAVMVAPPTGVKNLDAVAEYYHAVAGAARLPLVIQDEPVTTQVTMPPPFIARLVAELPSAEAVKLEEAPTLPKITRLRALFERPVAIFGGLGGVYFFEELSPRRPAGRGACALLPVAPAHPLREPARRRARDLRGDPEGNPATPGLARLGLRAPARARPRSHDARRADGDPARLRRPGHLAPGGRENFRAASRVSWCSGPGHGSR